jgi:hypothetical protein
MMSRFTMNLKTLMEKKLEASKPQDVDTVVEPVEEFFDVDEDKAAEKLSDMSIDDNLSLIDSVRKGDKKEVAEILDEDHTIGDDVKVKNKDAVVSIPNGPGDTTGALIDGELKMVKNSDIDPINEAILGMSRLPGLNRMMELAGIQKPDVENNDANGQEGEDENAQSNSVAPASSNGSAPANGTPTNGTPTNGTPPANEAVTAIEPAPEVAKVEIATAAPAPQFGEYQPIELPAACASVMQDTEAAPALETVRSALDQIEGCISNLTVAEYREIRDRLTKLQNAIFESASVRRKKSL